MSDDSRNDELLTVAELADYLRVPVHTIYGWRHRGGGPPCIKLAKHLRFRRSSVEAWLAEREDR